MIIVEISGGLGNQFFQYAIGRSIAKKLNCDLLLDTAFYDQQSLRKLELFDFNIKAKKATNKDVIKAGGGRNIFTRIIHKLGFVKLIFPKYISEPESFNYVDDVDNALSGTYLKGYWQNFRYFENIRKELNFELDTIHSLSKVGKQFEINITGSQSVSIHVRRGDYVEDPTVASVHGLCTIEYYKKAIEYIKKNVRNPMFFVFSDDIPWCKDNFKFLSGVIFIENTVSGVEDLQLMKLSHHNIIANSSFSWWGGWLNNNPNKIVIAPKGALKKIPRPDSWIEI